MNEEKHIAQMIISIELFKDALAMPENSYIRNIGIDLRDPRNICVTIEHQDLQGVQPGEPLPEIIPIVTRNYDKKRVLLRDYLSWDWNL